jgi:hypothetical protein
LFFLCTLYYAEVQTSNASAEQVDTITTACQAGESEAQRPVAELEHSAVRLSGTSLRSHVNTTDKHVEMALRQQLQLELLKSQNLAAEVRLVQTQLKAETAARISLQVMELQTGALQKCKYC